jgi:hypothetical protein
MKAPKNSPQTTPIIFSHLVGDDHIGNWIANPCYLKKQPPIILGCCDSQHWTSQAGPEVVFLVLDITGGCWYNLVLWNGGCLFNFYWAWVSKKIPGFPGVCGFILSIACCTTNP